jgi:hypothetical protein
MNNELFELLFNEILDALDRENIEHDASIIDRHVRAMVAELETA